jgi:hypothetical protein
VITTAQQRKAVCKPRSTVGVLALCALVLSGRQVSLRDNNCKTQQFAAAKKTESEVLEAAQEHRFGSR